MSRILFVVPLFFLIVGNGCSNITVLRVAELKQIESHVDSLRAEVAAVNEKLLNETKSSNEILRLMRADQQVRFGEIERGLKAVADNVTESQTRLSRIDEKTQVVAKKVEERMMADSLKTVSTDAEMENLFSLAMQDFTSGRYDIAVNGFKDLIARFPQSSHAEEGTYWKAECYYLKNDLDVAEVAYKEYIKAYPTGRKIPVTLFKLGMVYDKKKMKKSADAVWEKLVGQYPDSEEAKMAKQKIGK